jgi:hypothetical protein
MEIRVAPYFNASEIMKKYLQCDTMYSLCFKYAVEREKFLYTTAENSKTVLLRRNGCKWLFSIKSGYTLDDVVKEIEGIGFVVNVIE